MSTFSPNGAEHPALTASRSRLEHLERRTPPGYPLGYSMHIYTTTCNGCGSVSRMSQLWTVTRAGAAGRAYHPSTGSERMYDLPVEFVNKSSATPRCEGCIGLLAREPVPALPAYKAVLKPGGLGPAKVAEIDLEALGLDGPDIDLEALGIL